MQSREHIQAVTPSDDPTLGGLLGRTVDLAQRVAVDELRLLRIESQEQVRDVLRRGVLATAGALCALFAWISLWATIVVLLEPSMWLWSRLALVTGAHALIAAALIAWMRRERTS